MGRAEGSLLCSRRSPLWLGTHGECARGRDHVMSGRGWGSQLCSRGLPLWLGKPISCAPGSPWIGIQWVERRGADHR